MKKRSLVIAVVILLFVTTIINAANMKEQSRYTKTMQALLSMKRTAKLKYYNMMILNMHL